MEDIEAEERNDKIREGALHPAYVESTEATHTSPEEGDAVMMNSLILFIGVVGLAGLAGILGSIFIFSPLWVK